MRNALVVAVGLVACGGSQKAAAPASAPGTPPLVVNGHAAQDTASQSDDFTTSQPPACGGAPMTVKFYNAGQALAALVTLPDGKHVLVDAGDSPKRAFCSPCKQWHQRVMDGLAKDLGGADIDMLWVTHLHSDHLGGVPDVEATFHVLNYVDNGRTVTKGGPVVDDARNAAKGAGTPITTIDQKSDAMPISSKGVELTAIVPPSWLDVCDSKPDENMCSIALRIDYCGSSVLFTGDMGVAEEQESTFQPVTLLQVGHHGSETSTGEDFLGQVRPKYAVISAGLPDEGTNKTYCHPRASTVEAVTASLGGPGAATIDAYASASCSNKVKSHLKGFAETPASDNLWATSRDGDITLATVGDGVFTKAP